MKIAIDLGHGVNFDGGAVGIRREEDLINETGELVINKLSKSHQIIRTRPLKSNSTRHSLQQRCDIANYHECEVFVSLHFNSFTPTANGVETFAVSKVGWKYAENICKNIAQLGYTDRGAKDGRRYYVIRNTKMPAIIVEGCFVTNQKDMALFNAEDTSDAIVEGILSASNPSG
jgi:N-acetylmuramoyl-L-alanine amidase